MVRQQSLLLDMTLFMLIITFNSNRYYEKKSVIIRPDTSTLSMVNEGVMIDINENKIYVLYQEMIYFDIFII